MERPLKIGIVCYPTIGGSGIVATELGRLVAEVGHEVHFISYERPVRLPTESANLFFHPVTVNEYPLFKYPDYTLPLSVRIAEVSEEFDLDILHVHYAVPHATAALLARLMLGEKRRPAIITTLHGTDTNLIGTDDHYRPIIRYSIENSCGVTTVSESLKRQTLEVFGIDRPIEVIPNFFAPSTPMRSRAEVRADLAVGDDEFLLSHLSNLRPGKRVNDILEAISISKNRSRLKLLVLAGGDFTPYEAEVRRLGLTETVRIQKDVHHVDDYLNASDIGIYASDQESFGLSILETLAHGKPVIATHVGGIPEVVKHGETGLLVPPHQPAAIAQSLDRLIETPALRESLGRAARQDVANRFHPRTARDHYLAFYRKFLSPPASKRSS